MGNAEHAQLTSYRDMTLHAIHGDFRKKNTSNNIHKMKGKGKKRGGPLGGVLCG